MALASSEGWLFLLRWNHFLAGITWIGLLYYFNFVQTPFFAETEAPGRGGAMQKLVPRALWWFRWGAMLTFLSGWLIIIHRSHQGGFFAGSSAGRSSTGATREPDVGQRLVCDLAQPESRHPERGRHGCRATGEPGSGGRGSTGGLASRTNTLLSVPMLFFMGAASHLTLPVPRNGFAFWIVALAILLVIEVNALKGTPGQGAAKPLATVNGTLWAGFILWLVY